MRINTIKMIVMAMLILPLSMALPAGATVPPSWNATGTYVVNFNYMSVDYAHDMVLTQDSLGNLTGNGGSPSGANVYTWVLTSGSVLGNSIDFLANYTATADAVTPQTTMHVVGTIASNGAMTGTWSDNYQGGVRTGTWATISGVALPLGALAAEDFGVVNYDTGLGMLKGYTAGFGVTDATFAGATSVVVKLYAAGDVLLQTNTAILPKFNADITGTQFSSPFDVSGNFQYVTDGYWTNVREAQYGQSVPAMKVVATVTLANGKVVTAENSLLTGDPTTIYPVSANVITNPATLITSTSAMVNGTNGATNASDTSFWWGTTPVVSFASPSDFPSSNWSHDSGLGSAIVGGLFSEPLTGLMPNTTYYFVAWSNVGGTWYPGAVLSFTTIAVPVTVGPPTDMNQCKDNGWKTFNNPTFKNQGQCVRYVQENLKEHKEHKGDNRDEGRDMKIEREIDD